MGVGGRPWEEAGVAGKGVGGTELGGSWKGETAESKGLGLSVGCLWFLAEED